MTNACFVAECLENNHIHWIRRKILQFGGVFHECYAFPGVFWNVTFRDEESARACAKWWDEMNALDADMKIDPSLLEGEDYYLNSYEFDPVPHFRKTVELPWYQYSTWTKTPMKGFPKLDVAMTERYSQ